MQSSRTISEVLTTVRVKLKESAPTSSPNLPNLINGLRSNPAATWRASIVAEINTRLWLSGIRGRVVLPEPQLHWLGAKGSLGLVVGD